MPEISGLIGFLASALTATAGFVTYTLIPFLVLIGFIVIVHELGHYAAARLGGLTIKEFSVGFGPRIATFQGASHPWTLRAIPLGGYVLIPVEGPGSLETASLRSRLGFLAAGPAVNVACGIALFTIASLNGLGFYTTQVERLSHDGTAYAAHVQPGDRIVAVDGISTASLRDLVMSVTNGPRDGSNTFTIARPGTTKFDVTLPRQGDYGIGFETKTASGLISALALGIEQTYALTWTTIISPFLVTASGGSMTSMLSGPVGIAHATGEVVRGPSPLLTGLQFAAALSISIALFNLLPLPNVDGGRMMMALGEALTRRKTPVRVQHFLFGASYGALICGMLLITVHDVVGIIAS